MTVRYTISYMAYDPERITLFAKTDARGKNVPFGIKAKDRTRHVYVIGKTGMGKSTLLENMAVQDIKNGEGMAFIDPHGQTAETLLDYIPEERKKDVLYFAPFDTDHPVSFNVMEDVGPDKRHLVVSGLMSTFKKIWVDAWSARMEYILSNTLLALLEYPDSTLLGVNRMLSDKVYRKKVIDNITDPAVKAFWVDEFLKYNERYMQEAGDSIKNKTGQFTANPLIRNIIGQPKSSFDLRELMDNQKIIIVNLSKGLIGETNANLLGSMFITRIYLSAMSRAELSPAEMNKMSNFYFYVDEFQSFANEAFANILSEARKYKLNLTIAHQYIEQMEEEVRNAVFGNVGTTISFRVGPFDAEVLETVYAPKFYAVDICNLGFAQVYLTLMIDGIGSPPFSAVTLPPIHHEGESFKDVVINESRTQFTSPRTGVEDRINEWLGMNKPVENKPAPRPAANQDRRPTSSSSHQNDRRLASSSTHQNDRRPTNSTPRSEDKRPTNGSAQSGDRRPAPPRRNSDAPAPRTDRNDRNDRSDRNDRLSGSDNSSHQTERRERPTPERTSNHARTESPATNKNLEDLRSVLAGISKKDDDKKPERNRESNSRSNDRDKRKPDRSVNDKKEGNLRSALAGVLDVSSESNDKKVTDTKSSKLPEKQVHSNSPQSDSGKTEHRSDKPVRENDRQNHRDKQNRPQKAHRPNESRTPETSKADSEEQVKSPERNQSEKQQPVVRDTQSTPKPSTSKAPPAEQKPEVSSESKPDMDPKMLERMMRLKTTDTTPLK